MQKQKKEVQQIRRRFYGVEMVLKILRVFEGYIAGVSLGPCPPLMPLTSRRTTPLVVMLESEPRHVA